MSDLSRRAFAGVIAGAAVSTLDAKTAQGIDVIRQRIGTEIVGGRATGMAVALTKGRDILWEEGFGWSDRSRRLKASRSTPFCLASLTKPFTAATIMTLVAAGKVSLDDAPSDKASVRMLGAHNSGLPALFDMVAAGDRRAQPSLAQLLDRYGAPVYPPGKIFEYSNVGYALLGSFAERLQGLPFARIIQTQLLDPLGLHDSFFASNRHNAASRYDELNRPIPWYSTATPPSGELWASVHDVAQFAMFNLKNHVPGKAALLPDQWIDELHRPVYQGSTETASTFGWFTTRTSGGLRVIVKDGGQPGVSTIVYLVPSENISCTVLANRTDNGELVQGIADEAIRTLLPSWSTPEVSVITAREPFPSTPNLRGLWRGVVLSGRTEKPVVLNVTPDGGCLLSIAESALQPLQDLAYRKGALVGRVPGRMGVVERDLGDDPAVWEIKLLASESSLKGRLLVTQESPGQLRSLPYSVTLERNG